MAGCTAPAGDLPAAVSSLEAAAAAAQHAGLPVLEADALHMLAIADEDRAPVWTSQALGLVRGSSDPEVQRWAVALENNHAWFLMERGRPWTRSRIFRAAHDAALAMGAPNQERVARVGRRALPARVGRVTEALEIQREPWKATRARTSPRRSRPSRTSSAGPTDRRPAASETPRRPQRRWEPER